MKKIINKRKMSVKRGFTLVELLVVVAIISLLTTVVLSSLANARMKANDTKIAEDLRQFKIAAELYYNDYHQYPDVALNENTSQVAVNEDFSWINKLAFFTKKAEAAPSLHSTALCKNFDIAADSMVSKKYLAARPVHPYDNDTKGICYKAAKSSTAQSFTSYAVTTAKVNTSQGLVSKRTGFIIGDTSSTGIRSVNSAVSSVQRLDSTAERGYPAGFDGTSDPYGLTENLASIDAIEGITSGSPSVSDQGIISAVLDIFTPSNTAIVAPTCTSGQVALGGVCVSTYTGLSVCPYGYTKTYINTCASNNSSTVGECSYGATKISSSMCYLPDAGCPGSLFAGTCSIVPTGSYVCTVGKTFVINGSQGTSAGTCQ